MAKVPLTVRPIESLPGFHIREANALEYATIADMSMDLTKRSRVEQMTVMAEIATILVCDEKGEPIFSSADEVLGESAAFVQACSDAALSINGMASDEGDTGN